LNLDFSTCNIVFQLFEEWEWRNEPNWEKFYSSYLGVINALYSNFCVKELLYQYLKKLTSVCHVNYRDLFEMKNIILYIKLTDSFVVSLIVWRKRWTTTIILKNKLFSTVKERTEKEQNNKKIGQYTKNWKPCQKSKSFYISINVKQISWFVKIISILNVSMK